MRVFPRTMKVAEPVLTILRRLDEAGHEAWCVGGAVRDAILRRKGSDVDIATAATPEQVMQLFPHHVPVGVEHGTVGVLDENRDLHEVTTYRRDVITDGRHAKVEFGVSIDDDLARRDFTINAIAYHPFRNEWYDPFNGLADLNRRIIRTVGNPTDRFREDRLRILRAIRFAATLYFTIDDATWAAACAEAPASTNLSAERVREEWWKSVNPDADGYTLINHWSASKLADLWLNDGVIDVNHEPDLCADNAGDPILLLAMWRHPIAGILRRLKASGADIARGDAIDKFRHLPLIDDPIEIRRWLARVGDARDDLMAIHASLVSAEDWWISAEEVVLRRPVTTRGGLAVSGKDLIAEGIAEPGPELGRVLDRLLDAVLVDPDRNEREELLELARSGLG